MGLTRLKLSRDTALPHGTDFQKATASPLLAALQSGKRQGRGFGGVQVVFVSIFSLHSKHCFSLSPADHQPHFEPHNAHHFHSRQFFILSKFNAGVFLHSTKDCIFILSTCVR